MCGWCAGSAAASGLTWSPTWWWSTGWRTPASPAASPPLLEHYHTHHDGFASVITETEVKCAGDGVTAEWFQTELETSARFLASEVKPEKERGCEEEVDILDTSLRQ